MDNQNQLLVPGKVIRHEMIVSKSRFISILAPVESVEGARAFIAGVRKDFPDANHHVSAFIIGHGLSRTEYCHDDGEPKGSAGRPALAVLKGSNLGDVVVVVTRYFGGIKLGIGGLVKAYGDAVRSVINIVPKVSKVETVKVRITYTYSSVDRIRKLVSKFDGEILEEEFEVEVKLIIRFVLGDLDQIKQELLNISKGTAIIEIMETGYTHKRED